jgi:hypothetical protein
MAASPRAHRTTWRRYRLCTHRQEVLKDTQIANTLQQSAALEISGYGLTSALGWSPSLRGRVGLRMYNRLTRCLFLFLVLCRSAYTA